jgi:hypothetical protein
MYFLLPHDFTNTLFGDDDYDDGCDDTESLALLFVTSLFADDAFHEIHGYFLYCKRIHLRQKELSSKLSFLTFHLQHSLRGKCITELIVRE